MQRFTTVLAIVLMMCASCNTMVGTWRVEEKEHVEAWQGITNTGPGLVLMQYPESYWATVVGKYDDGRIGVERIRIRKCDYEAWSRGDGVIIAQYHRMMEDPRECGEFTWPLVRQGVGY